MPVDIHAIERPLYKIFTNDYAFSIPPYQRPYAWGVEQASELLSDLVSFLEDDLQDIDEKNPYFLGSIVLIKEKDRPKSDIVDGQQRLTTITILLSVLRNLVEDEYALEITKYIYEKGDVIVGTPNRYRLKLRERDDEFFKRYIQDDRGIENLLQLNTGSLSDSQLNMYTNAKHFYETLVNYNKELRIKLLQYLMKRCYLVVVSTPDLDSAYRIFSVLNARGLDLQLTDLLKSQIIGAIPIEHQKEYTKIWEEEEELLGREMFQELFSHIRMIYRKAKLRENILAEYNKYIKPAGKPIAFIERDIKPYSNALDIIRNETYLSREKENDLNSIFYWLNQIDNFDWVPPALVYFSVNKNDPKKLIKFFTDLDRLASGLMIYRADVNRRIDRYARLLTAIESNDDLYSSTSPLQLMDEEKNKIIQVLNGDIYSIRRIRQYVLLRLDSALSEGEVVYNFRTITVEHVLPQNPALDSEWLRNFPIEEERLKYTHCIGNLVLLSRRKNSQAQNYDFAKKKERYFTTKDGVSPFVLTTQVLKQNEWTANVIESRQNELLKKLKELWRL